VRAVRHSSGRGKTLRSRREHVDLSIYWLGLGVFARNPTVVVLPLLVAVIGIFLAQVARVMPDPFGLVSFILQLLNLFALGVSIIIADAGWRRGVASFDEAWHDARRKAGDIIFAAFGFTFVLQIALLAGQYLGAAGIALTALAVYGLIFTIPAAAIGGVPGGAAINASVERVKSNPLTSGVLAAVAIVLLLYFGAFVGVWLEELVDAAMGAPSIIGPVLAAVVRSVAAGYVAVVMAKVYAEVAFSRW
jgi:hypothetical protein